MSTLSDAPPYAISYSSQSNLLVGSGPGHPSLLTIATYTALTQWADLVLSDKLVPDPIFNLIPKHISVCIAKKFPGNVEIAQIKMMEAAVDAANKGLTVVRVRVA
jgi:uroporphyrin-III C-methyltransferase